MPSKKTVAKNAKTEEKIVTVKTLQTEDGRKKYVERHKWHRRTDKETITKQVATDFPELVTPEKIGTMVQIVDALVKQARKVAPPKIVQAAKVLKAIDNVKSSFESDADRLRVIRGLAENPDFKGASLQVNSLVIPITADVMETIYKEGIAQLVLNQIADKLPEKPDTKELDANIAELQSKLKELATERDKLLGTWREKAQEATGIAFGMDGLPIVELPKSTKGRNRKYSIRDYKNKKWTFAKEGVKYEACMDDNAKISVRMADNPESVLVRKVSPSSGQHDFRAEAGLPEAQTQNAVPFWGLHNVAPEDLEDCNCDW